MSQSDDNEGRPVMHWNEPGLSAPLADWEDWLRRLAALPIPDDERRELESFAKQIINGFRPGQYPEAPPL